MAASCRKRDDIRLLHLAQLAAFIYSVYLSVHEYRLQELGSLIFENKNEKVESNRLFSICLDNDA